MIRIFEETGSTNADLAAAIRRGEAPPVGEWLVARRQRAGRGRHGRTWHDGAGNFMGSTVLALPPGAPPSGSYAFPVSVALYNTVEGFVPGEPLLLKWPNDLLLRGAKVSGILMELVGHSLIVGIGVNLAYAPQIPGRATIALSDCTGRAVPLEPFAEALAAQVAEAVALFETRTAAFDGETAMRARWLERAHPVGTALTVDAGEGPVAGQFWGLSSTGAMMLRRADGGIECIHAGDVGIAEET